MCLKARCIILNPRYRIQPNGEWVTLNECAQCVCALPLKVLVAVIIYVRTLCGKVLAGVAYENILIGRVATSTRPLPCTKLRSARIAKNVCDEIEGERMAFEVQKMHVSIAKQFVVCKIKHS